MAHPVNLLIDGGFFFDIGIRARHIGFGLIIVIIGDEIFHRVIREQGFHLAIQLGGQGFVGRQDQGRPLSLVDNMRDGEGFAGPGYP